MHIVECKLIKDGNIQEQAGIHHVKPNRTATQSRWYKKSYIWPENWWSFFVDDIHSEACNPIYCCTFWCRENEVRYPAATLQLGYITRRKPHLLRLRLHRYDIKIVSNFTIV